MECPRCRNLKVVDPFFIEEAKKTLAKLTTELVIFADQNKIDHKKMPVLTEVAKAIRIIEML